MSFAYTVEITGRAEIHALEGEWNGSSLRKLLELAEFDDEVGDADLADITLMVLQDLGYQRAGEIVLEAVFGADMRAGQRQNLVDDLQDDRPWEEWPEISQQRGLFVAMEILQRAFPNRHAIPDAVRLKLRIEAKDEDAARAIATVTPAQMVRILAGGLEPTAVLHRLYGSELRGGVFAEAGAILWTCEPGLGNSGRSHDFTIDSSLHWFGGLEQGQSYQVRVPES